MSRSNVCIQRVCLLTLIPLYRFVQCTKSCQHRPSVAPYCPKTFLNTPKFYPPISGLCAAHYVRPSTPTDVALARRGLVFNVCFGDFIEAAYPFMERCRWCNASAYVGSAISGAIVAVGGISSSAYLPLPLAFAACETPGWLMAATFGAFLPAFCIGLCRPAGKQGPQDPFPVKSVDNQRR